MSKSVKIWLIIAASLILLGGLAFAGGMTMLKWDFTKLTTSKYETNHYTVSQEFKEFSIHTNTADIEFMPSEDESYRVVCYEQKNLKHAVEVKDGTLSIEVLDTRKWYEYISINVGSPKITVYLPQGEYGALSIRSDTGDVKISKDFSFRSMDIAEDTGDVTNHASVLELLKIKTTTGNICVENSFAGTMALSVSTGNVTVSNVSCKGDVSVEVSTGKAYLTNLACQNLTSNGDTGDLLLKNVIAEGRFSIERSTGDVTLEGSDAAELFITTDTGDVEGSVLSEKVFLVNTDTGKKEVPNTITGGRCEITTDTGDIKIKIQN